MFVEVGEQRGEPCRSDVGQHHRLAAIALQNVVQSLIPALSAAFLRVDDTLHIVTQRHRHRRFKTVLAIPHLDQPLGADRLGQLERLAVLLLRGPVFAWVQIQVQIFIVADTFDVDVQIQGHVARRHDPLPQFYRLFAHSVTFLTLQRYIATK